MDNNAFFLQRYDSFSACAKYLVEFGTVKCCLVNWVGFSHCFCNFPFVASVCEGVKFDDKIARIVGYFFHRLIVPKNYGIGQMRSSCRRCTWRSGTMAPPPVLMRHDSARTSCPTDWGRRDSDRSESNQVSEHLMLFPERNYKWHLVRCFLKMSEHLKEVGSIETAWIVKTLFWESDNEMNCY